MFIVAVTGGIATGKSTISRVFEDQGIPVIDADKIARESEFKVEHIRFAFNSQIINDRFR